MNKYLITLMLFTSFFANAQLTDLARLEYSFIPKNNSEDQYTRIKALVNYPIEVKEDSYIILGAEYNRIILNLKDEYPFDTSSFETLTVIDFNIAYTYKMNKDWRIGFKITPRLASTLTERITKDDLFLNGGVFFVNDRTNETSLKRPYRLILGLTYNTTTGLPFPLPFVSYYRRVNEKWSFSAGVPKSNIKYRFNENRNLQAFIGLDGYFANLQRPTTVLNKEANTVSLSLLITGLGYEYLLSKHLVVYAYGGYTLRLSNVLRDKDRENVYTLDDVNTFYLRTGIKFKI
ncbi:hypothetical protein ES045_02745 [Polaribacter sp. IC073]|nr:hypothetical protein ES045_02745 [Polaribacter sp. IC073]